jgi:hypothetical protein
VWHRVLRQDEVAARRLIDVRGIAGDNQQPLAIVSASRPDCIDEQLVHTTQCRERLLLRPGILEIRFFVQRFEDEVLVAVREMGRDLGPVALELLFSLWAEGTIGLRKLLLVVGIDQPPSQWMLTTANIPAPVIQSTTSSTCFIFSRSIWPL